MQLWDKHWSEQLAKEAVWLSGLVTFEQAAEIMTRVGQIPIATSSVWQRSATWGAQLQAVESQQRAVATALPTVAVILPKLALLWFVIGLEKFVWLNRLNVSTRN